MKAITKEQAKGALDSLIKKSRIHLYKPIQIAEILYRDRVDRNNIDLSKVDTYRTNSKKWRDEVTRELLGTICTSSAKYQDDLFNDSAIPPRVLVTLGKENRERKGAVEAYIYSQFLYKHKQLTQALNVCRTSTPNDFDVHTFINSFRDEPGLRRSLDKIYEIIVYSLFSVLVEIMDFKVDVYMDKERFDILEEFREFANMVMSIDIDTTISSQSAKVYRVGVTNAADRGVDMYSNWGIAIQVKHLSLDVELAEDIVESITSDRIVIVCKDAEKNVIVSLLNQIGWKSRIQSVVTENHLVDWYDKALRGKYAPLIGERLLEILRKEIVEEFPSIDNERWKILANRKYEFVSDDFWK